MPDSNIDVRVIKNGYDRDDFTIETSEKAVDDKEKKDVFTIAHVGTLSYDKILYFGSLLKAFKKLKEENLEAYKNLRIEFTGNIPDNLIQLVEQLEITNNVICNGFIDHKKSMQKIKNADVVLWFKHDDSSGDFATKFYEYVYFKKFIWVFSKKGEPTELIKEKGIGKVFYKKTEEELIAEVYDSFLDLLSRKYKFNDSYNTSEFDIDYITGKLIEQIWDERK